MLLHPSSHYPASSFQREMDQFLEAVLGGTWSSVTAAPATIGIDLWEDDQSYRGPPESTASTTSRR